VGLLPKRPLLMSGSVTSLSIHMYTLLLLPEINLVATSL
jgi:hypothetical protein